MRSLGAGLFELAETWEVMMVGMPARMALFFRNSRREVSIVFGMGGLYLRRVRFFSSRAVYRRKEPSGRLFNSGGGRGRRGVF
jgi:hypothetical protein